MRSSNNVYMWPSIWLAISFAKHNAYQPGAQCSLEVIPTSVPSDDQPDAPCGLEVISKCDDQSDAPCSLAAICEVIPKLSCNVMLWMTRVNHNTWSFFRSHSASFATTSVVFKNPSSGVTAFSFASKPASHLLSAWACHVTPSFSSSLTSFLGSLLHLRHLVYKCSTDCTGSLHHQHWGVSIFPIPAKYFPTAPCPTLSW